jgi:hypothetical protein
MDERANALGEIAADAAIERTSFLADAGEQLRRFLEANKRRIRAAGGMVLIDEDPDYLSVAPDGTFRSRTRYHDQVTGEWYSETEVIETAGELVELYNPADVLAAFADAARDEAGSGEARADEGPDAGDLLDAEPGVDEEFDGGYAEAADEWAAKQARLGEPANAQEAARRLYDLALTFQERSQHSEARLIEQFEVAASDLSRHLGDMLILDDEDERLWFKASGTFEAEVVPQVEDEEDGREEWRRLSSPDELVEFYDPTDVFGDFAEALAETYPAIAEDDEGSAEDDGRG